MNLTKLNWPKGWVPSEDIVNGDSDALLRMDNLRQNSLGALTLVRGDGPLNGGAPIISGPITDMFTKVINGVEYIWMGTENGAQVFRTTLTVPMPAGPGLILGANGIPCFGDGFGQVLACAGTQRVKDDLNKIRRLGIPAPTAPTIGTISQPTVRISPISGIDGSTGGSWQLLEGHDALILYGSGIQAYPDFSSLRGVVELDCPSTDTIDFGSGPSLDPSQDNFYFLCQLHNPDTTTKVRVEILLNDDPNTPTDYYYREWLMADGVFTKGVDTQTTLSSARGDFVRVGTDPLLDWKTVKGIKVSLETISSNDWFFIDEFRFLGGATGALLGEYQWCAVNVFNSGDYIGKSPAGAISLSQVVENGKAVITVPGTTEPSDDYTQPQINEVWLYRRSIASQFQSLDTKGSDTGNLLPDKLNDFYLVATLTIDPGADAVFTDTLSDDAALALDTPLNLFLMSLQDIPENIIAIEGPFNERILYLTSTSLLLSDRLNPEAIDLRYTIKAFIGPTEINLWLKKVNNNTLVLATSKDFYVISGTLLDQPDGTLDIQITPVGEEYPPLSTDVCNIDGVLFYVAADGVRTMAATNSQLMSHQLSLLFQGESRHGINSIQIGNNNSVRYPIIVARGQLYVSLNINGTGRRLFIYDLVQQSWRLQTAIATGLIATKSDRIFYAFNEYILELESIDNPQPDLYSIQLLTVLDCNQQPRNRKDTFTLKVVADTGGKNLYVYLAKDGDADYTSIGTLNCTGLTTTFFDISAMALGFRYSVYINSDLLTTCTIKELTIEYLPRPEQVNYMRTAVSNLGTNARKRLVSFPVEIDNIGVDISITPYVDGVAQLTKTIPAANRKQTFTYFFDLNVVGVDFNCIINGGVFEFYDLLLSEAVSEKMPSPAQYLVIPADNYGSPNRKRFTSIKFRANTQGSDFTFTPILDGLSQPGLIFNSGGDQIKTIEYFWEGDADITAIDIGAVISGTEGSVEFYGGLTLQDLENLPPRLDFKYIDYNNFGVAAPKRIRTLPLVINTNGRDVTYTPVVDGIAKTPSIINTEDKRTFLHYFTTDVFGIDYRGYLSGSEPFEFYGFGTPENVEVFPVAKKYDSVGPFRMDRVGKVFAVRIRIIATANENVRISLFGEDQIISGSYDVHPADVTTISLIANEDRIYEFNLPKSINSDLLRFTIGAAQNPFYRFDVMMRIETSGLETDGKWVTMR